MANLGIWKPQTVQTGIRLRAVPSSAVLCQYVCWFAVTWLQEERSHQKLFRPDTGTPGWLECSATTCPIPEWGFLKWAAVISPLRSLPFCVSETPDTCLMVLCHTFQRASCRERKVGHSYTRRNRKTSDIQNYHLSYYRRCYSFALLAAGRRKELAFSPLLFWKIFCFPEYNPAIPQGAYCKDDMYKFHTIRASINIVSSNRKKRKRT